MRESSVMCNKKNQIPGDQKKQQCRQESKKFPRTCYRNCPNPRQRYRKVLELSWLESFNYVLATLRVFQELLKLARLYFKEV